MNNKRSGWWTSLLPGASIVVCLAGCSAWADGSSNPGAFFTIRPNVDMGVGYNLSEKVITARTSFSVVRWGDLVEIPRLGLEFSEKWEGGRPTVDVGVNLKTLVEKLGATWQLDKSLLFSGYVTADLNSGKGLFDSLKYGIALSVIAVGL